MTGGSKFIWKRGFQHENEEVRGRIMTALIEITQERLGPYAEQALANGAVVPLRNKKPITKWGKYIDPTEDYSFDGLAIKTGKASGLTVVDYDAEFPAESNVRTRRGGHVWLPWDNDRTRHYRNDHIDVCGSGALAVFHSPTHQVLHTGLADRSRYSTLLYGEKELTSTVSINSSSKRVKKDAWVYVTPQGEYLQKVESAGYSIDVEKVTQALAKQVASTPEGSRNLTFFRNLNQVLALGGNKQQVINAAYECGLEPAEIQATVRSAMKSQGVLDIYDLAMLWWDVAAQVLDSPVLGGLAGAAIEQHTTNPSFNQQQFAKDYGLSRMTIYRHMQKLEAAGLYVVKQNGYRPVEKEGQSPVKWPNNYKLALPEY
jgi:biotin operon repressor